MRPALLIAAIFCAFISAAAQTTRNASHLTPTGKGWGESNSLLRLPPVMPFRRSPAANGILYHGGPVIPGTVHLYFVWYGNFVNGPAASDSMNTQDLLTMLFGPGGLGGSPYARINSTYADFGRQVTGNFVLADSANDYYSRGRNLSDASVTSIIASAINSRLLPRDANAVYFVLTSSDVNETSGFCTKYCGWHGHSTMGGQDIKIAFIGNPDRCPSACVEQMISPNRNSGADAMASTMAHEVMESINDPDLNAWYDTGGNESADKCAWKWGPATGTLGLGAYNTIAAGHHWLIQMNWENARGGGCDQKLGGFFYNQ